MTRKPHEDTRLAKYVKRRVIDLKPTKSQAEIAAAAGYANPNMITMIKQGRTKVALDRVPALAHALDCDPAYLMQLALEQAIGGKSAEAVVAVFGEPVTANERNWLRAIREASDHSDPRLTNTNRDTIRKIFVR